MKYLFLSLWSLALLGACNSSNDAENANPDEISADASLTFEVVDSVAIDYLGRLRFCDISPDGSKFLFHDGQRGNFVTTDRSGAILHEFIKEGDRPDFPGFLADNPVFFGDDRIAVLGPRKAYIYDLNGELQEDVTNEMIPEGGMAMRMIMIGGGRTLYAGMLDGEMRFIKASQVGPVSFRLPGSSEEAEEEGDPLDKTRAVMMVTPSSASFEDLIGLEPNSKFRTAQYPSNAMSSVVSLSDEKVYISYSQDPAVYVYDLVDGGFVLEQKIEMNPEEFFFDEIKPGEDFEMGIRPAGAGRVRFVYGYDDVVYTSYNPGVKMEDRARAEINRDGGNMSIRLASPTNAPADKYQYFRKGQKVGNDFEKPKFLGDLAMGEDTHLWFSRNITDDEEESDFIIFYKVRVIAKN